MSKLSKLNAAVNRMADAPFKYGVNDCYIFTSTLVKIWHGRDFTKKHAVYKSKKGAAEYMAKFGGIEALTTGTLGYSVQTNLLADGDVVLCQMEEGEIALGFVYDGQGLFLGNKTVLRVPLEHCLKGWRIT